MLRPKASEVSSFVTVKAIVLTYDWESMNSITSLPVQIDVENNLVSIAILSGIKGVSELGQGS